MLVIVIKIIYLLFSVYGIAVFCQKMLGEDNNEQN